MTVAPECIVSQIWEMSLRLDDNPSLKTRKMQYIDTSGTIMRTLTYMNTNTYSNAHTCMIIQLWYETSKTEVSQE